MPPSVRNLIPRRVIPAIPSPDLCRWRNAGGARDERARVTPKVVSVGTNDCPPLRRGSLANQPSAVWAAQGALRESSPLRLLFLVIHNGCDREKVNRTRAEPVDLSSEPYTFETVDLKTVDLGPKEAAYSVLSKRCSRRPIY